MNKYQEAFDYIVDATNGANGILKEMLVLRELVDKATPKKKEERVFRESIKYYVCPTCHSIILGHNKYCENCGQRIDGLE